MEPTVIGCADLPSNFFGVRVFHLCFPMENFTPAIHTTFEIRIKPAPAVLDALFTGKSQNAPTYGCPVSLQVYGCPVFLPTMDVQYSSQLWMSSISPSLWMSNISPSLWLSSTSPNLWLSSISHQTKLQVIWSDFILRRLVKRRDEVSKAIGTW